MRIIIVERRTIRIAKRDGYILILRLQAQANARNGAARTRSAGEAVDPAVHLRPDFLRCTARSEEHTSELQSLMRISYAVFCLKKKIRQTHVLTTVTIENTACKPMLDNYKLVSVTPRTQRQRKHNNTN